MKKYPFLSVYVLYTQIVLCIRSRHLDFSVGVWVTTNMRRVFCVVFFIPERGNCSITIPSLLCLLYVYLHDILTYHIMNSR